VLGKVHATGRCKPTCRTKSNKGKPRSLAC